MFTSRAEYRLILREDNVVSRICPRAVEIGVLREDQVHRYEKRTKRLEEARQWVAQTRVKPTQEINDWLNSLSSAPLKDSITVDVLVRRPELQLRDILDRFSGIEMSNDEEAALEIELKFRGYLSRQDEEIERLKRSECEIIPVDFCYDSVTSLRTEIREKLKKTKPQSIGQAMRIPGMTPSALSVLALSLRRE